MDMLKEYLRMCESHEFSCEGCSLFEFEPEGNCAAGVLKNYNAACERIREWAQKHPNKTYVQDFYEKFPKALKLNDGCPTVCRNDMYGLKYCLENIECETDSNCKKCWTEEMS